MVNSSSIQDIIDCFVTLYLNEDYSVINAYNNTDEIDLNGVITITANNIEHLNNGNTDDYKVTIIISGQFLTAEDVNQSKIYSMFDFIISRLDESTIKNGLNDCAGIVKNGGQIVSDGETNNCSYSIDLYMCKD